MSNESESISKIRDILFGNNLTELEKRFSKTESLFRAEIESIDEKTVQLIEEMKSGSKAGFAELDDRLNSLKSDWEMRLSQLANEVSRLQQLVDQNTDKFRLEVQNLKSLVADQHDEVVKLQKKEFAALKTQLFSTVDELRQSKLDRNAVAMLLSEIAVQMVDDGNQTDAEGLKENEAYD